MNTELRASLEAILLVADEPVPVVVLAQVLECPKDQVALELSQLAAAYTEECRGFDLREIAGGWRYYTREEYAPVVERFVQDGQEVRLTQAALETLAVVAYRQPVSRARVSAVTKTGSTKPNAEHGSSSKPSAPSNLISGFPTLATHLF